MCFLETNETFRWLLEAEAIVFETIETQNKLYFDKYYNNIFAMYMLIRLCSIEI